MTRLGVDFNELGNNGLFCLGGHTDKNTGTRSLAMIRKDAKRWWAERYSNDLKAMQTFILPPRTGAVYKADNWRVIGETVGSNMLVSSLTREEYEALEDKRGVDIRTFKNGAIRYIRRTRATADANRKLIFWRDL